MGKYTLRASRPDDAAALSYIHAAAWRVAYRGVIDDAYLDSLPDDHWVAFFNGKPDGVFGLVLEVDGKPVGTLHYGPSRDNDLPGYGEIYACYLLPDYWGQNYGNAMLARSLDELRRLGYTQASIWVLDVNLRAQKAYQRLGFAADGATQQHHVGNSVVTDTRRRVTL